MSGDVRQLFESLGLPAFKYRETLREERRHSAATLWKSRVGEPVEVEQTLPVPRTFRSPSGAYTIAFLSLSEHVGRTTLTANLAQALSQEGQRAVAVDVDPRNELATHFGLDQAATDLFRGNASSVKVWLQSGRFRHGAACLPFGHASDEERRFVEKNSEWLAQKLQPVDSEFVLLDTPAGRTPWLGPVLTCADELVFVLKPDEDAYTAMLAAESLLKSEGRPGDALYLINQYDARQPLQREIAAALAGTVGQRLIPFLLQWDASANDALAHRQLLMQEAPDSQLSADLSQLAEWLMKRRNRKSAA